VPYVFTITAQLIFTLRLRLPFWIRFVLFSLTKNTQSFIAHLVPSGTPIALSQFIVLIESVRQIIRPITLSVRLAANITAGHILIALARAPIIIVRHISVALRVLFLLELAVAFIQRYVFVVLLSIYLRETK
jgi:ATP synthase subunit 6